MATYRGSAGLATNSASGTSITCTLPTGWQPGDFCVIWGGVNSATVTFTDPAGWSLIYKGALSSGGLAYFYYYRILQAGDTDPVVPTSVSAAYRWASLAITPAAGNKFQLDAIAGSVVQVTTAGLSITPPPCVQNISGGTGLLLTMGRGSGTVTQTAFTNTPVTNYTNDGVYWGPSGSSYTGHPFAAGMYRLNISGTGTRTPSAETVASTPANNYFMASTHIMVAEVAETSDAAGAVGLKKTGVAVSGAVGTIIPYRMGGVVTNIPVPIKKASVAGDGIIVCTAATVSTGAVTSITDSKGNTYVQTASYNAGTYYLTQWAALGATIALTTSDTVTVNWTSAPTAPRISVVGCNAINSVDKTASANGSSTSPASGATATLTQASELGVAQISDGNLGGPVSWASPWLVLDTLQTGSTQWMNIGYQLTTSTAGVNAQGTLGTSAGWTSQTVTYYSAVEVSTGTGDVDLKKISVAGTITATAQGSGAVSLKKMGVSVTATGISAASGGATLKKRTISGSGAGIAVVISGPALKKMGVSGSGSVVAMVSAAIGLKKMTVSATGAGTAVASGSSTLKKRTISGSGQGTATVSGGPSLKKMGVSGAVSVATSASGAVRLKKVSVSATGSGASYGAGNVTLHKMGVSGSGSSTGFSAASGAISAKKMRVSAAVSAVSSGIGNVTLKKAKVSGTGPGISVASGAVFTRKMGVAGAGSTITTIAGNVSLKKMGVAGSGSGASQASGAVSLKKGGIAGSGSVIAVGSVSVSMKKMKIFGSGEKFIFADGYVSMKKMRLAGAGSVLVTAAGAVILKKMGVTGSGTGRSAATGAIGMKKMSIFGSGQKVNFVVGSVILKKMGVAATGTGRAVGTGAIGLKKMSVLGAGQNMVVITGDVRLRKMRVSGSGTGTSAGTLAVSLVKMEVHGAGAPPEVIIVSGGVSMKKARIRGSGGEVIVPTFHRDQLFIFSPL